MKIAEEWYKSAERSSKRAMYHKSKDLRWCPGIYTDPNTGEKKFNDIWTKHFLGTTGFETFDDLFKHVEFLYERRQSNGTLKHGNSGTASKRGTK